MGGGGGGGVRKCNSTEKSIELKANYHIVLHSVAGACVILHIFKTFEKPPKSIKVTPFHGI